MKTEKGWIGVDLDGTLAEYDEYKGPTHIGDPVPFMADRVRRWIKAGWDVRIMTARVNPDHEDAALAAAAIERWMQKHFGFVLPVTHEKDFDMVTLWDDRAVQVIPNTGRRMGEAVQTIRNLVSLIRSIEAEGVTLIQGVSPITQTQLHLLFETARREFRKWQNVSGGEFPK